MPTVNLAPGLDIHYIEENPNGRSTVLLIHGLGACGKSWSLQIPRITQAGFRVVAPDARGFGQSSYPCQSHTIRDMSNDMVLLLKSLNISSAHLVGISMGGAIALDMAISCQEIIKSLCLVNTFARLRPKRWVTWIYYGYRILLLYMLGLPTQARVVSRHIFPDPQQAQLRELLYEQIIQADPKGYRNTLRALMSFEIHPKLNLINNPTLVITGQLDNTVPPVDQELIVKSIHNAQQSIIPNAGHAVIVDQPDLFNDTLLHFLIENDSF